MASRSPNDVRVGVDNFWVETVRFSVSGSGTDMTGSLINSTNMNVQLTYPSGTVPGYSFQAPSGSVLISLPGGGGVNSPSNGRYGRTYTWHASAETVGTDIRMNPLARASNYQFVQYGHNTVSGTFLGGFVQVSGSATPGGGPNVMIGAIPVDPINPASPAAQVNVTIFARNTTRRT